MQLVSHIIGFSMVKKKKKKKIGDVYSIYCLHENMISKYFLNVQCNKKMIERGFE